MRLIVVKMRYIEKGCKIVPFQSYETTQQFGITRFDLKLKCLSQQFYSDTFIQIHLRDFTKFLHVCIYINQVLVSVLNALKKKNPTYWF